MTCIYNLLVSMYHKTVPPKKYYIFVDMITSNNKSLTNRSKVI